MQQSIRKRSSRRGSAPTFCLFDRDDAEFGDSAPGISQPTGPITIGTWQNDDSIRIRESPQISKGLSDYFQQGSSFSSGGNLSRQSMSQPSRSRYTSPTSSSLASVNEEEHQTPQNKHSNGSAGKTSSQNALHASTNQQPLRRREIPSEKEEDDERGGFHRSVSEKQLPLCMLQRPVSPTPD